MAIGASYYDDILDEGSFSTVRYIFSILITVFSVSYSVYFVFKNNNRSDDIVSIEGVYNFSNGSLCVTSYIPRIYCENSFVSLYATIFSPSLNSSDQYVIESLLYGKSTKESLYFSQSIPSLTTRNIELYSSWYTVFPIMIAQVQIFGDIKDDTSISITMIRSTKWYTQILGSLHNIMRIFSLITIFLFSLCLLINNNIHLIHFFSVGSLLLAFLCNINISFSHFPHLHSICLLLKGLFSSFNLISLFVSSLHFAANENQSVYIVVSILLLFADAMRSLTTDSFVVASSFDNNGVVWVFFFLASIVSRVVISVFIFINFLDSALKGSFRRLLVFIMNCLGICLTLLPGVAKSTIQIYSGLPSSLIEFFSEYTFQSIFSVFFALMHWPNQRNDPTEMELNLIENNEFSITRDASVQFEKQFE